MAAAKKKTSSSRAKKTTAKKPTKKDLTCGSCGFVSKSKGGLTNHKKTHAGSKKKTAPKKTVAKKTTKKKSTKKPAARKKTPTSKKRSAVKRPAAIKRSPQTAARKHTYTTTVDQHRKTEIMEQATNMTKLVDHIGEPEDTRKWNMAQVAEAYLLIVIITVIVGSGSFMAMLVQGTLA